MGEQIILSDPQIEVKKKQQLSFHQVHLSQREPKAFETLDCCVSGPMFVLRARVVQVLCSENERSKEDPVHRAPHTLSDRW